MERERRASEELKNNGQDFKGKNYLCDVILKLNFIGPLWI